MPRSLWLLVIGMVINVTGNSFLWPLNTIYIHDHLGKSLTVAGIVLMLNSAASVAGNLVGGTLFDKAGGYKSILLGILISFASLIGLVLNNDWPYYVVFLTILGFGSGIVFPSMYAMAGAAWPEGGRKSFNALYVAQNIGVAVGSALGGIVASYSFDYIFAANTIMYVLFLAIALFGYKNIKVDKTVKTTVLQGSPAQKGGSAMAALLVLCVGYLLCWVAYVQWQSNLATYTQQLNIPLGKYSMLWAINGALIVLAQPLVVAVVKNVAKTLKSQIILGILIFIVSFGVVANVEQFAGFVVAMVILTIGEMFIWPAVPTIANDLAPKGREGFYQGVVNSTATGGRMVGPLLGGILVDLSGMRLLFVVLMVLLAASIVTTLIYDRKIKNADSAMDAASEMKANA